MLRAIAMKPELEDLLNDATQCLADGDLTEAKRLLGKAEKLAPTAPEVRFLAAELTEATDGDGLAAFEALAAAEPTYPDAALAAAAIHLSEGNLDAASRHVDAAIENIEEDGMMFAAMTLKVEILLASPGSPTKQQAAARTLLTDLNQLELDDPADFMQLGELWLEAGDAKQALAWLTRAAEDDETRADALHAIGAIYDEAGDAAGRTKAWLEVARLDADAEKPDWDLDEDAFNEEAEAAFEQLCEAAKRDLETVPLLIEEAPSEAHVREGVDPRALGLFQGAPTADRLNANEPTVIRLFRANIAAASLDEDDMREQVRITVLHETAHYFGLDDDQLDQLGLG